MESVNAFNGLSQTLTGYLTLLNDAVVSAAAVTLAGIVNLLAEQYRARRDERFVWHLCGMTRVALLRTYSLELVIVLLYALLLSLPLGYAMCQLVDLGARSFGFSLLF